MSALHFLDPYLGPGKAVAGGTEVQYQCPFCQASSRHFYVNYTRKKYVCHSGRCNSRGSLEDLVKKLGLDPSVIQDVVPTTYNLRHRLMGVKPESELTLKDPGNLTLIQPGMPAWDYLVNDRKISPDEIYRNGLSISDKDKGRRIYFVEMDEDGNVLFWVARKYMPGTYGPKYLNAANSCRSNVFRISDIDPSQPVHVCEGPISAIVACPNALATYGVEVSDEQIARICALNAPYYLVAMDGEAYKHSEKVARKITAYGKTARIVPMPSGEDPASLGRPRYAECVSSSFELRTDNLRTYRERLARTW